jgi:hypothetical protein
LYFESEQAAERKFKKFLRLVLFFVDKKVNDVHKSRSSKRNTTMRELVRNPVVIDYGSLEGVLPGPNLFPCDIDGILEVSGNFLLIETKFHDGPLPIGQRLWLERLSKLPNTTVLIVVIEEVKTSKKGCYFFLPKKYMKVGRDLMYKNISLEEFKALYKDWYFASRRNPK